MGEIRPVTLKNGKTRYRFVVDVGRDPVTGKRKQLTCTYDTKREARAELARITHEAGRGVFVQPSKRTVNELLDEYLKSATRDVEKATAANYRDALKPVRYRLGDRVAQQLVEVDVEDLVDYMLSEGRKRGGKPGTGLSVRSARLTLGRFRSALAMAVRRQWVVRNVAIDVRVSREAVKRERAARARHEPWTESEVKAFLAAVKDDRLFAVMLLALIGMRPAEVCGLRWSDADLEAGTVRVGDNTRTIVDGQVEEKGAKSEKGKRALPLPAALTTALKTLKTVQKAERLAAGKAYTDTGYVLVDELGQPCKTDWLRRRAYKLMESAGVRKVRLYDARHSCLTFLAGAGVPDVVLAAWAGHADGGTLAKRVYIHPDASHLKTAADQLDKMLG